MNKYRFSITLSVMLAFCLLIFSANASAVDFSPATQQIDSMPAYATAIDTGVAVAASGHQCSGCHAVKVTYNDKFTNTPLIYSASGGDPAFALASPTSKADMMKLTDVGTAIGGGNSNVAAFNEVSLVLKRISI